MDTISDEVYDAVKRAYLSEVEIPQQTLKRQYVLCPIGLVGAGKTTVLKPLARRLSLVRLSGDELRKHFKERGHSYARVTELMFELADHFLDQGYSLAIDSDCIAKIKEIRQRVKEHDAALIWIHINPPEEFIINKLSNLTPNWLGTAEEMVANYYERKPLHAHIDLPFTYVFDTSRPDLEEQLEAAARAIQTATQQSE